MAYIDHEGNMQGAEVPLPSDAYPDNMASLRQWNQHLQREVRLLHEKLDEEVKKSEELGRSNWDLKVEAAMARNALREATREHLPPLPKKGPGPLFISLAMLGTFAGGIGVGLALWMGV